VSDKALRITMLVLGTIGLGVAAYLTYVHYSGAVPLCGKNGGSCLTVQTSAWSKVAGVPVTVIGLVGYVSILVSLLVPQNENARLATMVFTVIGFAFSAYLTYRELFSIHAICEWCVSSAVIMTILMCLSIYRFLRGVPEPAPPGGLPSTSESPALADGASGGALAGTTALDGQPLTIN
jgi:uncharacterized membrane protein